MAEAEAVTTPTPEVPTPEAEVTTAAKTPTPKRKKAKRTVASGQVHVQATFNNTIVTFTDGSGNVLTASSAGACGFRGSKKGTAYAAQVAAERAAQAAKQQYGFTKAEVFIKGVGLGRDAAVRVLSGMDIAVESIRDVTGVPHGGVRPRKARRI
ncbi:MAG TPA: 30S ribosomal protein S11 [Verrucomicrobiae bacterium]|jgi:small subunit ribosomal protein S11|nr:30S ribosomal protein S11 [Verrucomicrobiae bacterium]